MNNFSQTKPQFKTKEDQVYEILRDAILTCDLKPGEKLVIDQLSQQLAISTIPIRAAIQRLGMEGLVDIRPHKPARIAVISLSMVKETFALLAALEQVAFETFAEHATPEQVVFLDNLVQEMDVALQEEDLKRWVQQNIAFHRHIAEFTDMRLLVEFTHRVFDQWQRVSSFYFKSVPGTRIHQAQEEHRQILEHIKNRNVSDLIALAKHHNQAAFESYQALLQEK